MLVATCNVNGIRAAVRKGMLAWVEQTAPDVLLLQEVRAPADLAQEILGADYQVFSHACEIAGRAGVAVALKKDLASGASVFGLSAGLVGVENEAPVDTGRWLEVAVPELDTTFISAYLHSGDVASSDKMNAKYAHLARVDARLKQLATAGDVREVNLGQANFVFAGDFNIVHRPVDIKNWKPNHNKTAGVLDEEIAYLERWFGEYGLVDIQRYLTGADVAGPYTWWSQRGKAFDNDSGWRIDYQVTNPALAQKAESFTVHRAPSYDARWSDHAPLVVQYA